MRNSKINYEGIYIPGIGILIMAHYAGFCLNGLCTPDWLNMNLIICFATVLISLWFLLKASKSWALYLYRETKNLDSVEDHYKRVRLYGYFGIVYSIAILFIPKSLNGSMIYGTSLSSFIILLSSVIVVCVTSSDINRIRNRR
jgi:hypothetical protein